MIAKKPVGLTTVDGLVCAVWQLSDVLNRIKGSVAQTGDLLNFFLLAEAFEP